LMSTRKPTTMRTNSSLFSKIVFVGAYSAIIFPPFLCVFTAPIAHPASSHPQVYCLAGATAGDNYRSNWHFISYEEWSHMWQWNQTYETHDAWERQVLVRVGCAGVMSERGEWWFFN